MNTQTPITAGSLDWYREKGRTNLDIAVLVAHIDRMAAQSAALLEEVARLHRLRHGSSQNEADGLTTRP
jgi:hypothetical protein